MKPLLPHVHKTHGHISKLVVTVVQYGLGRKYQIRNSFYFCHHSDFLSTVRVAIELCVLKENAISVRTPWQPFDPHVHLLLGWTNVLLQKMLSEPLRWEILHLRTKVLTRLKKKERESCVRPSGHQMC